MRPPAPARLLLRLAVRGARRDELESDLEALFLRRAAVHGRAYARRRYWDDVLSFCTPRPRARMRIEKGPVMAALLFDLRQAARAVVRQPSFFMLTSFTLAIGFAAHLSAFSLVDRMLLALPPGLEEPARVFRLHVDRADRNGGRFLWWQTPWPGYQDLRQTPGAFAAIAAYRSSQSSVGSGADARQITVVFADAHYFPLMGASPQLGRVFDASEDRPPSGTPVAVLSDAYWRSAFGADAGVLGRPVRIGAVTYTVIGVMPRGFNADVPDPIDAWAPLHAGAYELPSGWEAAPLYRSVNVIVRLAKDVAKQTAAEQATDTYRRAAEGTAAADPTAQVILSPLEPGRTQQGALNQSGQIALWLQGVAVLVLLVALANVVNLQMARAAQQRREIAVRVALGAGRARLLARTAFETLFIAGTAAVAGVLLTYWSATTLQRLLMPGVAGIVDGGRFAVVTATTAGTVTLICVALAALQVRVGDVADRLKTARGGDGFRHERLRQGLLVTQVVMSALLLVGAGLFLRSIERLGRLDFGHDQDRVLVVTLPLRGAGYAAPAIETFYERARRELAALPGVEGVAAGQSTPFAPSQSAELRVAGLDRLPFDGRTFPTFYTVTPEFFATMGMKILRGRGFTEQDTAGAPGVMLLEQRLADALFPGRDPIGQCLFVGTNAKTCREVVGVTSNTRRFVRTAESALRYYVPLAQRVFTMTPQALFVRTGGDPATAMPAVRRALLAVDPNLPHVRLRTLAEMAEPEKRPWRLGSTLFVVFGLAALLVAASGVYALLSFMVAQRSREIGVRLALGATPSGTLRLIVRQSIGWVAAGLVVGEAIALAAGKFVQPLLFETSPRDVVVLAGTAAVLVAVAIGASLAPALRASRVDPNVALRTE